MPESSAHSRETPFAVGQGKCSIHRGCINVKLPVPLLSQLSSKFASFEHGLTHPFGSDDRSREQLVEECLWHWSDVWVRRTFGWAGRRMGSRRACTAAQRRNPDFVCGQFLHVIRQAPRSVSPKESIRRSLSLGTDHALRTPVGLTLSLSLLPLQAERGKAIRGSLSEPPVIRRRPGAPVSLFAPWYYLLPCY